MPEKNAKEIFLFNDILTFLPYSIQNRNCLLDISDTLSNSHAFFFPFVCTEILGGRYCFYLYLEVKKLEHREAK